MLNGLDFWVPLQEYEKLTMQKILLIEDDLTYSRIIKNFLEKNGFEMLLARTVNESKNLLNSLQPDLIITDYRLPDGNGMEILELCSKKNLKTILITNYSDIGIAVKAMKMGALDYITKPINPDELLNTVKTALAAEDQESKDIKTSKPGTPSFLYLSTDSEYSKQLNEIISLVAPTDFSVLILGETGSGKEYVAKKIHEASNRKNRPFVAIDCGALSQELAGSELFGHVKGSFTGAVDHKTGQFELANGGTLFLDEIGNLSYEVQVMLLRAIQERQIRKIGGNKATPIDVRIIAATNEDLKNNISSNTFREDLFHRLNEFEIKLEPLRNRKEDIPAFVNYFISQTNRRLGKTVESVDGEVMEIFFQYAWPGNLRELKNIIKRAVLLSPAPLITKDVLPEELRDSHYIPSEDKKLEIKEEKLLKEKEWIEKALLESKFNKTKAAQLLGIDRKTLYNKMEKYGIS